MNAHDTALNAYAYYGITTPEDERAAGELESEGIMAICQVCKQEIEPGEVERLHKWTFHPACKDIALLRLARFFEELRKPESQDDAQPDTPGQRED